MKNILERSIFSIPTQVQVTRLGITFSTTGKQYEWQDISSLNMYYTIWNGEDILGNVEFFFKSGESFRINESRTGADTYYMLYHALEEHLIRFSEQYAEALAMADFRRKSGILRLLGLFTNLYWGRKPVVFEAS